MTPRERKEQLLLAVRAAKAHRSLLGLTQATVPGYQTAWFHRLLARKFEEVSERVRATRSLFWACRISGLIQKPLVKCARDVQEFQVQLRRAQRIAPLGKQA